MQEAQRISPLFRRLRWAPPIVSIGLATLAVGLGLTGAAQVMAQPKHPITFVVEDGLPLGITQASVEAAADGQALSRTPFTMAVVERELTWDESEHGVLPYDADVMLSVGYDPDDEDFTFADTSRVGVSALADDDDWHVLYDAASAIRESYLNNAVQGHGPSAVVGAAHTAASVVYDRDHRSPVLWIALAALPLLVAVLIMVVWLRRSAQWRAEHRTFSRARLRLARVVLELDLLEAHFAIASAELDRARGAGARAAATEARDALRADWDAVREQSLRLAHAEQLLTRELIDPTASVHAHKASDARMTLAEFDAATHTLRRRADALAAASSLRVGHGSGETVLAMVALPTVQAVDEILRREDVVPAELRAQLSDAREHLLVLVEESERRVGDAQAADVVLRPYDLIRRWNTAERGLSTVLGKLSRMLQKAGFAAVPDAAVSERERDRIRAVTGGESDSLNELRASLSLGKPGAVGPSFRAERVLLQIEGGLAPTAVEIAIAAVTAPEPKRGSAGAATRTTGGLAVLPVIAAVVAGWIAAGTADGQISLQATSTEELAAMEVTGDLALLDTPRRDTLSDDDHDDTIGERLTLDDVRSTMTYAEENFSDPLLPERIELIVVVLPFERYGTTSPDGDGDEYRFFPFANLLAAYADMKAQAVAVVPEILDSATGDVRSGYAILPLWVADDGSYTDGLPLSGELSTGVDSNLGEYAFLATEPWWTNEPGSQSGLPLDWLVATAMSDLGEDMLHNHQRDVPVPAATIFWAVAGAVWTAVQTIVLVVVSVVQLSRSAAGSRRARRELSEMRKTLNTLALGLDLSRLDALAVLGQRNRHAGRAAEADQALYETALFTAWREVTELEDLPRRQQRGSEWTARVARLARIIDALAARDRDISARALEFLRGGEVDDSKRDGEAAQNADDKER